MAKCSFEFDFPIRPEELIRQVGEAIRRAGGELDGDVRSGFYSVPTPAGTVEGSYAVSGQTIRIEVLEKPVFLPCSIIEKTLLRIVRRERSRCTGAS